MIRQDRTSSEYDSSVAFYADNHDEVKQAQVDNPYLKINDFVIVRFATKRRVAHYVGQVEQKVGFSELEVNFFSQ